MMNIKSLSDMAFEGLLQQCETFRNNEKFVAKMIRYTPRELIDVMFGAIPAIKNEKFDTKIAVIYTIEMAFNLLKRGFTDITMIIGEHDEQIKKTCNIIGIEYKVVYIKGETKMPKFDVVVGNPPYQSLKKNSDQLWPLFIEKSINMASENGYIGLVVPDTWASGTRSMISSGRTNFLSDVFSKHGLCYLSFDVEKYFPGVGSGFSAFVSKKNSKVAETHIIVPNDSFYFNLSNIKFIHRLPSVNSLNITKRVLETDMNAPRVYFKFHANIDGLELVDKQDEEHKYYYANTSSTHNDKWGNVPGGGFNRRKVIMTYMGANIRYTYDIEGNMSLMHNGRAFYLRDTPSTVEGLKSIFESKLVQFLNKDKWSQYNEPKILNFLPQLNYEHTWTDEELYKYFNLAQEQIDEIELNVG